MQGIRIVARGTALALLLIPTPADAAKKSMPAEAVCAVVSIIDGDTIKCFAPALDTDDEKPLCRDPTGKVVESCWPIRLLRIDTGETTYHDPKEKTRPRWICDEEYDAGIQAKEKLAEMVKAAGGIVYLTKIKRDYYPGRRDAEVVGGGVNFSDALLRANLAAPYKGSAIQRKSKWCHDRSPLNVTRPRNQP